MTNVPERLLITNNAYQTPPTHINIVAKTFPNMYFYKKIIDIVFSSSGKSKKGLYDDAEWSLSSYNTIKAIESVGVQIKVTGLEHIKNLTGPCVFAGNHMSILETFALCTMILPYQQVTFVVKQSLVEYPVFKNVIKAIHPIVVGRTNPREDLTTVLKEGTDLLNNGKCIILFPQKTRAKTFNAEEFNTIGVKLAKRANVPIIPIALKTDAWGQGKLIKDFGPVDINKKVYFAFGEAMNITGNGHEEHQKCIQFIESHLADWQAE